MNQELQAPEEDPSLLHKVRRTLIGGPKNIKDPSLFHKLALIPILARKLGFAATSRFDIGTDIVHTAVELCEKTAKEFPRSTVFAGQSVFRQPNLLHRLLHNETAFAIQQELRWRGITTVILPIRINI